MAAMASQVIVRSGVVTVLLNSIRLHPSEPDYTAKARHTSLCTPHYIMLRHSHIHLTQHAIPASNGTLCILAMAVMAMTVCPLEALPHCSGSASLPCLPPGADALECPANEWRAH